MNQIAITKHHLHKPICSLLLVLIFFTSTYGQTQTDSVSGSKTNPVAHPKLIKTQGTDKNQNLACGLMDKAGNLWFGTSGEGVYRYDGKLFTNFTTKDGLNSNVVHAVLEDKTGNIWFGTDAGLCHYNGKTFTNIPIIVADRSYLYSTTLNNTPSSKIAVWSMLQDRTGNFWFGTLDRGIYRYDGKTFARFLDNDGVKNDSGIKPLWVERILEDKAGNIWFGGRSWNELGVCRYDGRSVINFKPDNEAWLRPLLQDKAGNIWFGSRKHMLYRYDGTAFNRFAEKEITDWVFSMAEDTAGNLWFSNGKNGGVTCYDGKNFKYFTVKDGLNNNSVWCIVKDRGGYLWFGTKNIGLCRYDGKTFTGFSE